MFFESSKEIVNYVYFCPVNGESHDISRMIFMKYFSMISGCGICVNLYDMYDSVLV